MHRDIKPENILMRVESITNEDDGIIKIADWGLSAFVPTNKKLN
jgi:serine/threonine protein kinase